MFRVCFRQLPSYAPTHKAQLQRAGKRHCGRAAGALAAVAHEFVADGSIVVALDEYSGTYKPTGKGFSVPFAHMWKLQDGKATSFHQYANTAVHQRPLQTQAHGLRMSVCRYGRLTFIVATLGALFGFISNSGCVSSSSAGSGASVSSNKLKLPETGYASVNGINMYYEVHGRKDGVPLVLLHGGGSTIDVTFGRILPVLADSRKVIAVEEQGHGRTTDRDAPVRFESSADDVAALLRFLKVERADLFGFSNGASVALQVAIRHPERVRKLVFASSITRRDGAHPQLWEFMKQADFSNMPQPLKDAFLRVNPDAQQLRTMHDKDAERMQTFEDVPDELLRSVRVPTLIVLGDQDIVKPEHAIALTRLIPGARLLILPGGHGDYLGEALAAKKSRHYPELTARIIIEFLDSW